MKLVNFIFVLYFCAEVYTKLTISFFFCLQIKISGYAILTNATNENFWEENKSAIFNIIQKWMMNLCHSHQ